MARPIFAGTGNRGVVSTPANMTNMSRRAVGQTMIALMVARHTSGALPTNLTNDQGFTKIEEFDHGTEANRLLSTRVNRARRRAGASCPGPRGRMLATRTGASPSVC